MEESWYTVSRFGDDGISPSVHIMNGNEGSNSLALYACLDQSLCDLAYIAIGTIKNN